MKLPVISVAAVWCCAALSLCACSTPSSLVGRETEIFTDIQAREATRIAVFLNWAGNCEPDCCAAAREIAQEQMTGCLGVAIRSAGGGFEVLNGGALLDLDTSALINDPRRLGAPDPRFGSSRILELERQGIRLGLIVDLHTVTRDVRLPRDVFAGGDGGMVAMGQRSSRAANTSIQALLVDISGRRWLARLEDIYSGREERVAAMTFPFFLPFVWAKSDSTQMSACESIGRRLGRVLRDGSRGMVLTEPGPDDKTPALEPAAGR